ncbi:sulfite exporter TauE/SafE family protein [Pseudonocardiaceae bacterium YIM PH 21723]|nr:sulfite exporter TauE/SafE family protein [Pseudonocardiaceae bacterium YIM PH 21723]
MDLWVVSLVVLAGVVAGLVNAIAGAGSLLTFPALVGLGLSPLAANVSNCVGISFGNASTVWGFRGMLAGQRPLLVRLLLPAVVGSLLGAGLLLCLPSQVFVLVAPALVALGAVLTLIQPLIARKLDWLSREGGGGAGLVIGIFATSVYGGYFGSGIGVIFLAVLGMFVAGPLSSLNAIKSVLQLISNGVAGLIYCFTGPVAWPFVAALAAGSIVGGLIGARVSRYVSALQLRIAVGTIGLLAAAVMAYRIGS